MRAKVFKFCIHLEIGQVYCGKENEDLRLIVAFFFHFSISRSNVIIREICVKDFSGTTAPRILKFSTNVGYDLLYCVKESACCCLSFLLFVHFSFSPIKLFVTEFQLLLQQVFKFCIQLERGQVYCEKENQDSVINFCLLFTFFLFSISHSNVIHREICVKDFSGTTVPRILTFGSNVGCDLLYCVKENQPAAAYHCLICPFFFLSKKIFCYKFLRFYENQSLQILYIHWEWPSILWDRNKTDIYFAFFLLFSICHSNVIHREVCDKQFSGSIARRIL